MLLQFVDDPTPHETRLRGARLGALAAKQHVSRARRGNAI